jgi:hypothetical protein
MLLASPEVAELRQENYRSPFDVEREGVISSSKDIEADWREFQSFTDGTDTHLPCHWFQFGKLADPERYAKWAEKPACITTSPR